MQGHMGHSGHLKRLNNLTAAYRPALSLVRVNDLQQVASCGTVLRSAEFWSREENHVAAPKFVLVLCLLL